MLDNSDIRHRKSRETSEDDIVLSGGPDSFHLQKWHTDLHRIPQHVFRQILGYRPFKTSYFALYKPLNDTGSRCILFLGIILAIGGGVPLPLIGLIFGHIINSFPPPENELIVKLGQLLGVAVAYFVVTWGWAICWGIVGERVARRTREALVKKAMHLGVAEIDIQAPDIGSMITASTQTIQIGTSEKVGLFIQSISYFVAAFTVGFTINARLTGILLAAVIPTMIVVVTAGTVFVSRFSQRALQMVEAASQIAEGAISSVMIVQAFGAGDILASKHQRILQNVVQVGLKKSLSGAIMLGSVFFIAYSANALAFWEGSHIAKNVGAGSVYAVVFLILDASFVVGQVGPFIQTLALAASSGSKVLEFIGQEDPDIDINRKGDRLTSTELQHGDIVLHDVSFTYPTRQDVLILSHCNLTFKVGSTTGIVGLSGSGKSTIASLLLRFFDPDNGFVSANEQDLRSLDLRAWRSCIALVDQDPVLSSGTILDNVSQGLLRRKSFSEAEIARLCKSALKRANASFVFDLADGLYTRVGTSGQTSLSGGQKQRICLARALVRDPSILILDEPTSALDSTSEKLILESLRQVSQTGCTVIMIAHRLATIRNSDNIVVMGQGTVLEQGSHEELMESDGAYRRLVDAQALDTSDSICSSSEAQDYQDKAFDAYLDDSESTLTDLDNVSALQDINPSWKDSDSNQNNAQMSIFQLIKRSLQLSRPERWYIIIGVVASAVSGSIIVGEALVFGNLVELINRQSSSSNYFSRIDFFCLMFFILALIALVAYTTSTTMFGLVSEQLVCRSRDLSLRTILRQDISWFSKPGNSSHSLMAKVNTDSSHLGGLSGPIIGSVCSVIASIFGGIVLAHVIAWKIAIVLLAAVPIMIVAGYTRLKVLSISEKRQEIAYNEAAAIATEACTQIRTVAAFSQEDAVIERYRIALEEPYKKSFKFNFVTNFFFALSLAITYFAYALAYWWGSKQVRNGHYSERDFFIVLPALLFSAQASGQVFSLAPEVARAKSAARSIFALHDENRSMLLNIVERNHDESESSADTLTEGSQDRERSGSIEFESVSFSYSAGRTEFVLRDLSFSIAPGEFVGVVGPSGAGKSSFITLLERFYDPTFGRILFEGKDIKTLCLSSYRASLGLVSQEPDLFPGSISFNISLGAAPGIQPNQADIETVCKTAGLHDFISSLPEGYTTECGANGSKLSGGQKQRIAIARALLRKPKVLLLDEATASLDAHSEKQIQAAVAGGIQAGQTIVVVAHRLSTIAKADKIIVLDKGSIVAVGRHEELASKSGLYAEMVKMQGFA